MTQPSEPVTLVLATRNAHKAEEIRAILGAGVRCLTLADFPGAPAVAENAPTFAGNAIRKAVELARWLSARGTPGPGRTFVLADDSGLEVDALNGAPGVYSARFAALDSGAAGNSPDAANNEKLLRLLSDVPPEKRTARFRCVLALTPVMTVEPESASPVCYTDAFEIETQTFEGICEGSIDFAPRGEGGFGYDPLFVPTGFNQSFAELGEETKNRLSHRARALAALRTALRL
ncbi:MAG TPA: non-canonical purine NTP pyrophosphatase [Verrucomicrobia bacterium]|nr:non-canonical purine NTP pyrophosphatase [Verrucomicrobiota bacterium]HOB32141.1 non-canonical purine NTP pyrophosphatase [Verrucomicrobiota bacterium]HOP96274.1 non-canonical purine NTP pyrophosphatase [Verrucomicrobiota bacterium]HPU57831.1 non-canonical purine NTP pyrophosphatase [Verrucomicrobiota bacterium]